MRYVVLYTNGEVNIAQIEPPTYDALVSFVFPVETLTDALAIKSMVSRAYALGSSAHETLLNHAEIVRNKNNEIAMLENTLAAERTRTKEREVALHNVMCAIALDMALKRTHRQRNAAMRVIVRLIKRILDNMCDAEDIPF